MTAPTLNTIGFRCPDCGARLVSCGNREYRCSGSTYGPLYRFSLDARRGIVLTLKDERFSTARDGQPTTPALPTRTTPRLLLIDDEHFREEYRHEQRNE